MTLDTGLTSANVIVLMFLFAVLIWRRVYRELPVFTAYLIYTFLPSLASILFSSNASDSLLIWSVGTTIDTLFYLCVLAEVARAVFRYNDASPPPRGLVLLLFLGAALPIGMLAQWPALPWHQEAWRLSWRLSFRVLQATAVLEVSGLLTVAWCSGLNKLRWPERELRLVMGMGTWALVQLCVLILHENGFIGPRYHWLDLLTPVAAMGAMIYWVHWFWFEPGPTEAAYRSRSRIAEVAETREDEQVYRMRRTEQGESCTG